MPEYNLNAGEKRRRANDPIVGRGGGKSLTPLTRLLLLVCAIQFLLLAVMTYGPWRSPPKPTVWPSHRAALSATPREPYFKGKPGPWGELEYARINLEPPDEFVPTETNAFGPTHWFFERYTHESLSAFFSRCELSAVQQAELTNAASWVDETNGIVVAPGDDLVLGLSETARSQIYSLLAKSEINEFYCWPFKFREDGFDAWFERSQLSPGTLALLRQLVYTRGASLCFSDLPVLFPRVATVEERQRLIKTLARTPALLMKLKVNPDSDVKALADYWAKGWRNKDVQTLLESLAQVPGGMTIDVAQLLPAFARKRLNTFPIPSDDPSVVGPNCYWTAMNFYRDPPDDRFANPDAWAKEVEQNYTIADRPTFGDVIFLVGPDQMPIHAVVYIADDVVFTKNGSSYRQPWMLMKWEDMIAGYPTDYPLTFTIMRPRKPME